MLEWFQSLFPSLTSGTNTIIMIGIGIGSMLFVYGAFDAFAPANPAARRYQRGGLGARRSGFENGLLYNPEVDPQGFMKALMPQDKKERSKLKRDLMHAGINGDNAILKFFMWRIGLALALPAILLLLIMARQSPYIWVPSGIEWFVDSLSRLATFQILTLLIGFGFFAPTFWLKRRIKERTREIYEAFPNTLDLIQISVEAGMGFDAAMTRVSNEMVHSAPAISQEFRMVQLEVAAGGSREKALMDMSERSGVDEVTSFSNVVLQSMQFGTSIADALTIYAQEMRLARELKAQEMANKLPVKMSAVMSSLMLPAMIILLVGPVAIRWMNTFGNVSGAL